MNNAVTSILVRSASTEAQVEAQMVKALYLRSSQIQYAEYFAATLFALLLGQRAPMYLAWAWAGAVLIVSTYRVWLNRCYARDPSRFDAAHWGRKLTFFALVDGCCWGA